MARLNVYQLVIPWSGGLRQLLLQMLRKTSYAAHLGIKKTTSAFLEWVWWPNLAVDVKQFVAGYQVCQHTKDVNRHPQGLLQPLPIP